MEDKQLSTDTTDNKLYITDNEGLSNDSDEFSSDERLDSRIGITDEKLMSPVEQRMLKPGKKEQEQETQFWIDDLITNYKKESFSR